MNEQVNGQSHPPVQNQGQAGPAGFGDAPRFTVDRNAGKKNEAVLGPFTIRDLTVFGSTLILFVASLIPMFAQRYNLWNLGSLFFLGLGIVLPLIVSALFVARRVSPGTKLRIGSLSVDQFASVVASFAVAFFFLAVAGAFVPSMLVGLVGALGLFAATVPARLIPYFAGDFLDREEAPAHVVAREAAVPVRKPLAPKTPKAPAAAKEAGAKDAASSPLAGWAKRMKPGGPVAAPGAAQRGHEFHGSSSVGAPSDSASSNRAAPGAAVPGPTVSGAAAAQAAPAAGAAGVAGTQASGVVPGTAAAAPSAAAVPSARQSAEQTRAAAEPVQTVGAAAPAAATAGAASTPAASAAPSAVEETRAADVPAGSSQYAPTTVNPTVNPQGRAQEPIGATVDPASRPAADEVQPVHEAFWFAVAQPRTAVDEHTGAPAFVIEPGGWVLALEDRGHEFLVQHTDGRVGVLRDLSNIERG
jgi:hypothetical protein